LGLFYLTPFSAIFQLYRGGRKPGNLSQVTENFITQCCIVYTFPLAGFELTTLVAMCTDCTGSCKSNYHMIMTTRYCICNIYYYPISLYICSEDTVQSQGVKSLKKKVECLEEENIKLKLEVGRYNFI
jgi:hypothetical protein